MGILPAVTMFLARGFQPLSCLVPQLFDLAQWGEMRGVYSARLASCCHHRWKGLHEAPATVAAVTTGAGLAVGSALGHLVPYAVQELLSDRHGDRGVEVAAGIGEVAAG